MFTVGVFTTALVAGLKVETIVENRLEKRLRVATSPAGSGTSGST